MLLLAGLEVVCHWCDGIPDAQMNLNQDPDFDAVMIPRDEVKSKARRSLSRSCRVDLPGDSNESGERVVVAREELGDPESLDVCLLPTDSSESSLVGLSIIGSFSGNMDPGLLPENQADKSCVKILVDSACGTFCHVVVHESTKNFPEEIPFAGEFVDIAENYDEFSSQPVRARSLCGLGPTLDYKRVVKSRIPLGCSSSCFQTSL